MNLPGTTREWCRFPSRRLPYTPICLSVLFLKIGICVFPHSVDFVRYLTFSRRSVLTILRIAYATMVKIRQDFINGRYVVKCSANAVALHVA